MFAIRNVDRANIFEMDNQVLFTRIFSITLVVKCCHDGLVFNIMIIKSRDQRNEVYYIFALGSKRHRAKIIAPYPAVQARRNFQSQKLHRFDTDKYYDHRKCKNINGLYNVCCPCQFVKLRCCRLHFCTMTDSWCDLRLLYEIDYTSKWVLNVMTTECIVRQKIICIYK